MADNRLYVPEEGSHWYYPDGSPAHHVPYAASNKAKAGEMRRTTMRDAKGPQGEFLLFPSVTVKLQVVAKPALVAYIVNRHLNST